MWRIHCAHRPLLLEALFHQLHVDLCDERGTQQAEHHKRHDNHDHDRLFRAPQPEVSVSKFGRAGRVSGNVLVKVDHNAADENNDEHELAARCHGVIKLPFKWPTDQKHYEECDCYDECCEQADKFEAVVD
eukprot:761574-Prymnesium_polylepis.1